MTSASTPPFRVALDAMGGDFGPPETVAGAVIAVAAGGLHVLLVGDPAEIQAEIDRQSAQNLPLTIVASEDVIRDGESPLQALRAKPKASAIVGVGLVKQELADAFVTMGSTGAAMAASAFGLGMMPGIERPGLGGPMYGLAPKTVLIEMGSSIDCRPSQLINFAALGVAFARTYLEVPNPRGCIAKRWLGGHKGKQADQRGVPSVPTERP
jgi:glycerol-3-phosphate acyltransferase PlsX